MIQIKLSANQPKWSSYLYFIFSSFFRNWWAMLTGCASIVAFFVTPSKGVILNGATMMLVTFIVLTLIFMTISTLSQGWQLYLGRLNGLRVSSFERNREIEDGWIFVIEGDTDLAVGSIIDIYKKAGAAEVPLALAQIVAKNSSGAYQAIPVGKINPTHIREYSAGGLRAEDLIVRTSVAVQRVMEVVDDLR